jgi:hypothetical protein
LPALAPAAEFVLNAGLRKQFENGHPDTEQVKLLVAQAEATNIALEKDNLAFAVKKHFDGLSEELFKTPENLDVLQRFSNSASLLPILPVEVNLWKSQNIYDQLAAKVLPEMKGQEEKKVWVEKFLALGEKLGFHALPN